MSERGGHRKLRLCSKKNYEKKRTEARHQALLTKGKVKQSSYVSGPPAPVIIFASD